MRRFLIFVGGFTLAVVLALTVVVFRSQAAPVAASAQVKIVNSNYYRNGTDLHVIGLVQNTTGTPQQNVHIFVSLWNKKHKLIGGKTETPKLTVVLPHATAPFDVEISSAPGGVSSITFKVTSDPIAQLLRVIEQQVKSTSGNNVTLTGSIQNMAHSQVYVRTVVGVAFNAQGQVVDVSGTACCFPSLEPGAIGQFNVSFSHAGDATRYAVYTQGTPES